MADAPVRLRRELDKVFVLQTQIDSVEQSIQDAKKSISSSTAAPESIVLLRRLEQTHGLLCTQVEDLYASLNIHEAFPELQDLPLDFVRTLLLMRDLKINIRKRAEGSFSEWDNLDRAVGGRRESLGQFCTVLQKNTQSFSRDKDASGHPQGNFQAPTCTHASYLQVQRILCRAGETSASPLPHPHSSASVHPVEWPTERPNPL